MRALLILALAVAANAASLEGRVYNGSNLAGVSDLTVTLTPPKDVRRPETVTLTDANGRYGFAGIESGAYLLRIHLGTTLIVREQINLDGEMVKDVALALK